MGLFFIALGGRSFYLQVVRAEEYGSRAEKQQLERQVIPVKRGVIYDRDGDRLAVCQKSTTIGADPVMVEDPETVARLLAPMLQMEEKDVLAKLASPGHYVCFARQVDPNIGDCVRAMDLPGVIVRTEDKRFYPNGALASQVLGYVDIDNKGIEGVELQYEGVLAGEPGYRDVNTDLAGRGVEIVSEQEPTGGEAVHLTIDKDIQFATEQILADVLEEFAALGASAIVLDPNNGEIIAMANTPVFDANLFCEAEPEIRRNKCITDMYEPGSTFKMVVVAAALSAGIVTPDTVYTLGPEIKVWDRVVHESHEDVPPVREWTVTEILAQSSNVGAVMLGQAVGKDRLVKTIKAFGFTEKLGIDFPGEVAGMMPAPDKWSGSTIANIPIGQGISVTALQMAAAYAAVANDGVLVQPHLARGAQDLYARRVIQDDVAAKLRTMLLTTVDEGTGKAARLEGYTVAGKTGTAQKVKEDGSGYSSEEYVASFVGMVPADSPRLVILVVVDEPTNGHLGSQVAAPAFGRIAEFALKQLDIPPTTASD